MATDKKKHIEEQIFQLLVEKSAINLQHIADACEMSGSDEGSRKAIQRVINFLIQEKKIIAQGSARARSYSLVAQEIKSDVHKIAEAEFFLFNGIILSENSKKLLHDISKPLNSRVPVGYNQEFLILYIPNKTYYLNKSERRQLHAMGKSENQIRPAGTYARHILNRLLIDLSWNSSRLEGNTYSFLETQRLIERGQSVTGKAASETQMILNHKRCIEYLIETSSDKKTSFHDFCSVHALLSENLLRDSLFSGQIRKISVGITATTYMPIENFDLLNELFQIFVEKFNQIEDPFEQSLFALIHLSYLQAFEDVNKRTARLTANISLIKKNLNPLSFADVNSDIYVKALLGVYEKNDISLIKDLYMWAYHRSSQKYSAVQQTIDPPDPLKIKHRDLIQNIIRTLILEKIPGVDIVPKIRDLIKEQNLLKVESDEIFKILEIEVYSLHDGNIARFKIRPSEFQAWKKRQ